jgi:hypothetical protein
MQKRREKEKCVCDIGRVFMLAHDAQMFAADFCPAVVPASSCDVHIINLQQTAMAPLNNAIVYAKFVHA